MTWVLTSSEEARNLFWEAESRLDDDEGRGMDVVEVAAAGVGVDEIEAGIEERIGWLDSEPFERKCRLVGRRVGGLADFR